VIDRAAVCLEAMEEAYTRAREELVEARWREPLWIDLLDEVASKYFPDSLHRRGIDLE
jgi:hypothetical protein